MRKSIHHVCTFPSASQHKGIMLIICHMPQALTSGAGESIPLFLAESSRRLAKDHRACRLMQRVEPATSCASTAYGQGDCTPLDPPGEISFIQCLKSIAQVLQSFLSSCFRPILLNGKRKEAPTSRTGERPRASGTTMGDLSAIDQCPQWSAVSETAYFFLVLRSFNKEWDWLGRPLPADLPE